MRVSAPFEPAICVRDLARAMHFYGEVLNMSVFSVDQVTPEESSRAGLTGHGYRIARMETAGGDRLKLAEPVETPVDQAPADTVLARHGFAYLTFIVPDLADVISRLQAAGATMHTDGRIPFRPGVELIFAKDPEGNFLEFVQRDDIDSYRPGGRGGRL